MKQASLHPLRSGFTMIEISIVLVIIGLIVGGVMVGRDMIHAAELRSIVSRIEKYETAVNTFKLKYDAIPGDFNQAAAMWGTDSGDCSNMSPRAATFSGNGNGTLDWGVNNCWFFEFDRVWQHLANAGLIEGQYSGMGYVSQNGVPELKGFSSKWGARVGFSFFFEDSFLIANSPGEATNYFRPLSYGHHMFIGGDNTNVNVAGRTSNPVFTSLDALNIDSKMDDGQPVSGKVVYFPYNAGNCVTGALPPAYWINSPPTYGNNFDCDPVCDFFHDVTSKSSWVGLKPVALAMRVAMA